MDTATSTGVRWQAPQKSTELTGESRAGLRMLPAETEGCALSIAVTCARPGPWQASQVTPSIACSGSNFPETVDAVEWQPKQRRMVSGSTWSPIACSIVGGAFDSCPGVISNPAKLVK